jgi:hypothetical protein
MATVTSLISVATKHVVIAAIEPTFVLQSLFEATAGTVDSDLGVGQ